MSSTSNYSPNLTCVPGRNVSFTNLNVCDDAAVSGDLQVNTINGQPYPPGAGSIPTLQPNKVLRTTVIPPLSMYWGDINLTNLTPGPADTTILSDGVSLSWSKLPPDTLQPGTPNQILTMTSAPQWSSSLDIPLTLTVEGTTLLKSNTQVNQSLAVTQNITAIGDISTVLGNISGSTVTATNLLTTLDANFTGNLKFSGIAGTLNQVLTKTSTTTQAWRTLSVPISAITNGANLTTLRSKGGTVLWDAPNLDILPAGPSKQFVYTFGGAVTWHSFILTDLPPGTSDQVITTQAGEAAWVLPAQIRSIRYTTLFAAQDLNNVSAPVQFSTSPTSAINRASRGVLTGISQPSKTQFTIGATGQYDIDVTGYVDPASTGPTSSLVTLSLEIGGTEVADSGVIVVNTLSFVGSFKSVSLSASNIIRILSKRVTGTGSFLTFAPGSPPPQFQSTISFSLVNTIA